MSDADLFVKARASELSIEFNIAEKKKNSARRRLTMKRVIANVTMGNHEMMNLFPEVLKLFSYDDVELKRMCYQFLNIYAIAKPETAVFILPSILSDLKSSNVTLVSLALKTLVSVPITDYTTQSIKPIKAFLKAKDPVFRKKAVFAIGKLYGNSSQLCIQEGLIEDLKYMMGDSTAIVVASSLAVLNDISEIDDNFSLSLNLEQALYLTEYLAKSDEWQLVDIINSLMNFVPQTHEDAHIIIDKVVPFFQHKNTAVVLNGFKLLLYLLNYVDYVEDYLTRKLAASLTSLLSKPAELQFLVLRNVILLILSKPNLVPFDVSLFFCDYKDPIYIKDTKLEIIYLLANESNLDLVLAELQQYSSSVDIQMSRKSIRAIGNLAVKMESTSTECVETLLDLVSFGVDYIVQEAVIVFKNILRRYKTFDHVVPLILRHKDNIDDNDSRASLIWIVGNFAEQINNPEQLLDELTTKFKTESLEVQLASLTAVSKLFVKVPKKGESLVLRILKIATEEIDNPDVRDRGFFYWRILSAQNKFPDIVKSIITGEVPPISNQNEQLDPLILQELELNIGSLASIYLKPVGEVFRLAKRKHVHDSPARSNESSRVSTAKSRLQEDNNSTAPSSSDTGSHADKYIDDFDVPALTVKTVKKQSGLSRRLTVTKSSLSRKLSTKRGPGFP